MGLCSMILRMPTLLLEDFVALVISLVPKNKIFLYQYFDLLGNAAKNEIASSSCATMKKAGHFKNDIYSLKSPNENWPRLAQCNMSGTNGYEDNDSMESLIGYINHSPIPVQPQEYMFSAYAKSGGEISYGNYVAFEDFAVNNGNTFDLSSGTFTAPYDGNYEFSFSGNANYDDCCKMDVYRNDDKIYSMYSKLCNHNVYKYDYQNFASTWLTKLDKGDTIRLKVAYGTLYSNYDVYSSFSGKLLQLL